MDIRNITEETPKVAQGKIFDEMFQLGLEQLEGYYKIEKTLPEYPCDINNPRNQEVLKDFIGRVIEELMEGYESTEAAYQICKENGWNMLRLSSNQELLNHLANANEEQADALGFYFTLFALSNILPKDILDYEEGVHNLYQLMAYGYAKLVIHHGDDQSNRYNLIPTMDYDQEEYDKINSYTPGFHTMSETSHENEKIYLWDVIYQLNMARNLLKCRPWKQTQVMTKEIDYQEALVKSFYHYMGFLASQGFTDQSLFELFFKKQRLNLWRQTSNY